MLEILQYLALIAAFLLPWMVGSTVKFAKAGERKKLTVTSAVLALCVLVIGVCVWLAFAMQKA